MSENKENKTGLGCLVAVVVFLLFIVFVFNSTPSEETSSENKPTCPSVSEMEDALALYKEGKIIAKFEPNLNTVYVTPLAEQNSSYDDYQTLGYICACYSAHVKGTGLVWVDIYSNKTHKKIAKYSESWGFKMEQ